MKHAKQTRAPWILLACLAAIALCIVAAVTLLQPNTKPKNIEIPGTRGNIPAAIQLPAKSARGEELPLVVLCHGFTGNRQGDGHFAPMALPLCGLISPAAATALNLTPTTRWPIWRRMWTA